MLTLIDAYTRGRRSQKTGSDWDDALARFTRKYCGCKRGLCALETAWADGWTDSTEGTNERKPK